jgi:beta-lactamase superfamily II metal-dependent hydrolase
VHFLNVGAGDCTLIRHNTKHNTLIDICKGNLPPETPEELVENAFARAEEKVWGNFGMSKRPTNPISYLQNLGVKNLFRFILTHPDKDHLDGFQNLLDAFNVTNFWHTGVKRTPPDFESGQYREEDWDAYVAMSAGRLSGTKVLSYLAGSRFKYANEADKPEDGVDGLYILAPDKNLVRKAIESDDMNDSSYVLLYRSAGGRIIIPGDAHDGTWDYVLEHYEKDVMDCSVLFAPHHGRHSGMDFSFLDTIKPKITFFGCASSGHQAYDEWSNRKLRVITNNQAGNIVLECQDGEIDIYVENERFAEAGHRSLDDVNEQGYTWYDTIEKDS